MPKRVSIPKRADVNPQDTWDLAKLFPSDQAWHRALHRAERMIGGFERFRGKLSRSAKTLRACCDMEVDFANLAEKVGAYAALKHSEDVANSDYVAMMGRVSHLSREAAEATSFIAPEIQAIPKQKMATLLKHPVVAPYRFQLEKLLRYRPHILSEPEERLLAMQGEVAETASDVFDQLNDADLDFGTIVDEKGKEVKLTHGSFRSFLESPRRTLRKKAFDQFYAAYDAHKNTLAATLNGGVLQGVFGARARNFDSVRESALFADKVPLAVYDTLVDTVRANLDTMYRYLALRRRALRLKNLHIYDTYVPIVKSPPVDIPYGEAVDTICAACAPLGDAYVRIMRAGLREQRWVDRYENQGKRSGAFSYGTYGAPPYILMNYRPDVLDSMFTLAHEAGHSMHSHHSMKAQPFQYAHYTIFVAEVASTFNEQLLGRHLMAQARSKQERARLISKEIDEIRGTIFRQTMFAEFERDIHAAAEAGEPLTLEYFRTCYGELLRAYFGPEFVIDEALELEGLRIPHFYNAFYVYKYATGLSAAIALAESVIGGGTRERDRYLNFLRGGASKYPLDLLRDAGVNLEKPHAVQHAMARFRALIEELESLI